MGMAAVIAFAAAISVNAEQLTESDPSGRTEVIASITGAPGDVSYIITIPNVVDFGNLTIPADSTQDYNKDVTFEVEATQIVDLDPTKQKIGIYVKDENATVNVDQEFHIANKQNAEISFSYDVYSATGDNVNASTCVNAGNMTTNGYPLTSFTAQGELLEGTLRFSQRQLYGSKIADIGGEYSGYMLFFSAIEPKTTI